MESNQINANHMSRADVLILRLRKQEDQYDQETHTRAKAAIRRAREAKEEAATRKIERATEVAKEAAARKEKETAEKEKERRARLKEMLEETEGVALNIAKAERAIWEEEGKCRKEGENEDGGGVDYENEVEALDWIYP